jgi:hypothetical protein
MVCCKGFELTYTAQLPTFVQVPRTLLDALLLLWARRGWFCLA